jgi:hypothetical protein
MARAKSELRMILAALVVREDRDFVGSQTSLKEAKGTGELEVSGCLLLGGGSKACGPDTISDHCVELHIGREGKARRRPPSTARAIVSGRKKG